MSDTGKQYESMYPPEVPRLGGAPVYSVQPREGRHCVTRRDGSVVKCHDTRAEADAHMASLVGKAHIPQAERDKIPAEDFAGPDRTFPIRNQQDVSDAARLIGHADDPAAVKRRIIAIAKRKGLTIPDAWQAGKSGSDMEIKTYDSSASIPDAEDRKSVV